MSTFSDPSSLGWGAHDLQAHPHRASSHVKKVPAERGVVLEVLQGGWVGAITRVEKSGGVHLVALEDRHGRTRNFPLGFGFMHEGEAIELVAPEAPQRTKAARSVTASGSVAAPQARARVARASRIWVEGKHDAQLIEKVWGDDLRVEGIVVEELFGVDHLGERVQEFEPGPGRKLGVLVDHLVPGSKESRIASTVMRFPGAAGNVLVLGHPYIDVWASVKANRLGLDRWPDIPRSVEYKVGILRHLGWPHDQQHDVARGWAKILASVRNYQDLEPALLGRVEELIDFLTAEDGPESAHM